MNSLLQLRKHSPNDQPTVKASIGVKSVTNEGVTGDDLVGRNGPAQEEVWAKLVGRANEERIFINWHPVTALLDTGSQVTHFSHDICLANGIQINPIIQLVNIEGTGGTPLNIYDTLKLNYPSPWDHKHSILRLYCWFCQPLSIRRGCLWL